MSKKNVGNWHDDCAFKDPSLPLAVVVTSTRWDEAPRIRHQVTRQLLRWFNVLYIEFLPCDKSVAKGTNLRRVDDRLIVSTPSPGRLPNIRIHANFPSIHQSVNRRYLNCMKEAIGEVGCHPHVLCNFVPTFPEVMNLNDIPLKIYFCYDEWPTMWRVAKKPEKLKFTYQSRLIRKYENEVARQADICLVSHTPLREKLLKINPQTILFLHGHEFRHPSELSSQKRKCIRVAYMGYITYNILTEWLFEVLNHPDIELNLIGPIHKFDPEPFLKHPNFKHVAPLSGEALQRKLSEMDVLIMPYNPEIPEVHVQTVSNKFFQYVAAGRPVVISNMPYYIEMPDGILYRADSPDDFVKKIRKAYAEDCDTYRELRAQIASENTWDKRGEQLHAILKEALGDTIPELGESVSS